MASKGHSTGGYKETNLAKVRWMIRASTSVFAAALGKANWAIDSPLKPTVIVCSRAVISSGKANGKANAASVDVDVVSGLYAVLSVNISLSSLRSIDLMT